jgi:hypothetical protein
MYIPKNDAHEPPALLLFPHLCSNPAAGTTGSADVTGSCGGVAPVRSGTAAEFP